MDRPTAGRNGRSIVPPVSGAGVLDADRRSMATRHELAESQPVNRRWSMRYGIGSGLQSWPETAVASSTKRLLVPLRTSLIGLTLGVRRASNA
jgi:hypothetical protein